MSSILRIIFTNWVASWIWDFLEWRVSMTDNCFMSPDLISKKISNKENIPEKAPVLTLPPYS